MKGRRKKTKYSMVFAAMVAMLSVCTAGVSTFAWFQASSEVRVSAASSSTTITVADPGETAQTGLYIFQDNYTADGSGSEGSKKIIVGKLPSERESLANSIAFDGEKATQTNFMQLVRYGYTVEGNTPAYYTAASSFLPGQRISFAILVDATATKARTLSISGFSSNPITNVHRYQHTGSALTTNEITLADGINVYATAISGKYDSSDKVFKSGEETKTEENTSAAISLFLKSNQNASGGALTDQFTHTPTSTATSYSLVTSTSSEDVLFLYTIEFGNSGDSLYRHVKANATEETEYVSPTFATGTTSYWVQDGTNGSSEVFQGLSFNITSLTVL